LVRSPGGTPYHFCRFPSDLLVFWPERTKRRGSIRQAPRKTPKKRTPKADRSEPAPGPNGRLLPGGTKRRGSIRSLPAPSAEAAPRFAFWPAPNCLSLFVYSRREPKGEVLSVLSRHRRQKQHRDSHFGRPRGLIAFKVYPFTPGEYQKAKFYPFSPGTVGRSSTAIRILAGPGAQLPLKSIRLLPESTKR
jgi:hypothetical protein